MTGHIQATEGIVDLLVERGVDTVFSLASEEIIPLLSEIEEGRGDEIDLVQCRHEQGAAAMADGYARATGDVGVCIVGRGPAVAQTGTSLLTASRHQSKVLYVVPESRLTAAHDGKGFQQTGFLAQLVGAVESIRSPDRVLPGLADVFRRLHNGEGPIAVQIPIDVLESEVPEEGSEIPEVEGEALDSTPPRPAEDWRRDSRVDPDSTAVSQAVEAYRTANETTAPVILAGRGAIQADAKEAIERLAEQMGAYLTTSIPAIGYFADHPYYLGAAGGLGREVANEYLRESDFILAFGASLNHHTLDPDAVVQADTTIVHVDTDPTHIGRFTDVDVGIVGDATTTADALTAALEREGINRKDTFWTDEVRREVAERSPITDQEFEEVAGRVDPRDLILALDEVLPEDRLVVTDVGQFIGWVFDGLTFGPNDRLLWTVDFLALGQGLPVGIGAAVAEPEHTPIVFCGDGGLMMILHELETAARYDVPMLVVVMDDEALGAEYHMGRIRGHSESVGRIPSPDFSAVASTLGAESHAVRSVDDVDALESVLADDRTGPLLLDCKVNPNVVHRAMGEMDID